MLSISWLLLGAVSLCSPGLAALLLPEKDPFYIPPTGFETKKPGTILRNRLAPAPLDSALKAVAAHQILYRTTDTFGKAIATVTTVLIPNNASSTKLLSYQVAEDAACPNCAPSYVSLAGSQSGGLFGTLVTKLELGIVNKALQNGWFVTMPDFLGPKAAFLANTLAGNAVLDGIRATIASSDFTKIASSPTITMWGYSGGSLATGFAAELQPLYAPELNITGAVLGGTCPDILSVMNTINKSFFTGLIATGIIGLGNEYPEAADLIASQLQPSKAGIVKQVKSTCLGANVLAFAFQDVYKFVKDPSIFNGPVVKRIADANNMGHAAPRIPLLIYKAANDEISPAPDTDNLVNKYCQGGASVDYRKSPSGGHLGLFFSGTNTALSWLTDRFGGKPLRAGCTTGELA